MIGRLRTSYLVSLALAMSLFAVVACDSGGDEIESTPQPTATADVATPTGTPTPSATSTVAPTATPIATATNTPPPTPAATPTRTPTPTPVPSPTPTPTPTADPRYGLIFTSDAGRTVDLFGPANYIDYTMNPANFPNGTRKILYLNRVNPVPVARIQDVAAQAPGSVWYILGEPNAHGVTVEDVLVGLHDTYAVIKEADPTALITSPSILNFSFNCINCGGYLHGATWITNFFFDYIDLFGEPPPIDIWAIDVFPLVWPGGRISIEDAFPTVRDDIVVKQIEEFREWVDSRESTRGAPIWITEFGLHWGFPDWRHDVEGCDGRPTPVGEYLTDEVRDYLIRAYSWFEANSEALNIERWFTFSSYRNITRCTSDSGNGLSFLDSPGKSANLTEIGAFYNDWIRGIR